MLLANPFNVSLSRSDCNEPTGGTRSLVARLGAAVLQEIRVRRSLRELGSLGDAMLHDLGVTRGGLEDVVRHGRARDHRPVGSKRQGCEGSNAGSLSRTEWR